MVTMLVRSILRETILPEETATVTLKSGKVVPSFLYALAFVKRYAQDADAIRRFFGAHVSYEDLQAEMLCTLLKAAAMYIKRDRDAIPFDFRCYLSKRLESRLYDIDTKAPRARFNRRTGEWQEMPPVVVESLEEVLAPSRFAHDGTPRECNDDNDDNHYPKALTVESVSSEIDDMATAITFLNGLTERQKAIVRLRFDHTPGTADGLTLKDVAVLLRINEKTVRRELVAIQEKFIEYTAATSTEDWLAFLKGIGK